MRKKLILTTIIAAQIFFNVAEQVSAYPEESKLFIDRHEAIIANEVVTIEVPPRVWQGTTMLPLRFVGENILGASVAWEQTTKTITMHKEGTAVQLTLENPQAVINGKPVSLTVPPFTEKDRTLVPLRFLAETFGYEVHYDPRDKSVLLRKALPPVAQFELSQDTIVAGQKIWAEDFSYDPYGYPITERRWRINRDPKLTSGSLASFFTTPPAGEYIIGLQVKNKTGVWSDWVEKTLIVKPNEPPIIEEFRPINPHIAQGENLAFHYRASNEPWEEIVEERWRYRQIDGEVSSIGKPRSFFQAGDYEVTLQVKDAYGNWSEPASTVVTVTDQVREGELEYKFSRPIPGEIIDNVSQINYNNLPPETNYRTWVGGPTLLLSNSPEAVPAPGILYRDKVAGSFRVMYHHKNNSPDVNRLVVVAENQGAKPVTLVQRKSAAAGPVTDVMHLGQLVALDYLAAPDANKTVVINPGEKYLLYQSPSTGWKTGQSLTGMFDLESDGPLSISIAAIGPYHGPEHIAQLPILPRDLHARGTFPNADRWVEIFISPDEPKKIEVGKDQQGFESWLVGYDALTGAPVIHKGNYGAVYYLTFHANTRTGVFLNPRGLTFKGAFQGFDHNCYKAPATDGFYGSRRAAVVGVIEPGRTVELVYTPPNGSDAPVLFGLIPEEFWPDF